MSKQEIKVSLNQIFIIFIILRLFFWHYTSTIFYHINFGTRFCSHPHSSHPSSASLPPFPLFLRSQLFLHCFVLISSVSISQLFNFTCEYTCITTATFGIVLWSLDVSFLVNGYSLWEMKARTQNWWRKSGRYWCQREAKASTHWLSSHFSIIIYIAWHYVEICDIYPSINNDSIKMSRSIEMFFSFPFNVSKYNRKRTILNNLLQNPMRQTH